MGSRVVGVILFMTVFLCQSAYAGLAQKEAQSYYDEGIEYQKNNEYFGAQVAYNKVLVLAHDNLELQKKVLNNISLMFLKQNKLAEAEVVLNRALEVDPHFQPALMNLGLLYEVRGEKERAWEHWLKAFAIKELIAQWKPVDFVASDDELQ